MVHVVFWAQEVGKASVCMAVGPSRVNLPIHLPSFGSKIYHAGYTKTSNIV